MYAFSCIYIEWVRLEGIIRNWSYWLPFGSETGWGWRWWEQGWDRDFSP